MRSLNSSARWLIAPALFLAFCSRGNSPTLTGPSSASVPAFDGGLVGGSAAGDVKVGTGTLEFLNLAIWGFNGDPGAGAYVQPGGVYTITPGVEVKLWATYVEGSPANPKFMVDWGDGSERSAGGCGACKATHTYPIPGLYTVKAILDDRVSTTVTRTFQLDARAADQPTPTGATCREIHDRVPSAPSGEYDIDPDGSGPKGSLRVYCDMDSFGGGWTNLNFATNQILLANGNRIDCTGDGGLTQTSNSIRCGAPLFNANGLDRNYLYHYRCDGQDSSMNWLVDHVGVLVGHRSAPTLGFATQANQYTGDASDSVHEYCYINGNVVLWNDALCAPYNYLGNGNCVPGWFTLTR